MHAVPHPESHVLCDEQGFVGNGLVIDVVGNVDETSQLFVDGVVGRPHPFLIIVRTIALNQRRMSGRDGIEVAIAVVAVVFLVFVEGSPVALHLFQFLFWGIVSCLPIAVERAVPHKSALLTLTQFVHHPLDAIAKFPALGGICRRSIGKGECAHIVSGTMSFQFGGGRVPSICFGIAFRGQSVGVAIVV